MAVADAPDVRAQQDRAHEERAHDDADRWRRWRRAGAGRTAGRRGAASRAPGSSRAPTPPRAGTASVSSGSRSTDVIVRARHGAPPRSLLRVARACSSASSKDAPSASIARYCITRRGRLNPSAPTRRPSRPNSATKRRSSSDAVRHHDLVVALDRRRRSGSSRRTGRTTRTAPGANGSRVGVADEERAARRATPCSVAFVQCSSRIDSPSEQRVGPAGDVAGGDDAGRGETGLVAHHAVVEREARCLRASRSPGATPTPTTTTSASSASPSARRTRSTRSVALEPLDRHAECGGRRRGRGAARRTPRRSPRPSPAPSARGRASSTVTSSPRPRQVAATSEPMKPAPITTTRGRASSRSRMRQASVERAQHEDAVELGLVGQAAGRGAGGDHQAVERQAVAGVELEHPRPPRRARSPSSRAAGRGRARRRAAGAAELARLPASPARNVLRQRAAGRRAGGARCRGGRRAGMTLARRSVSAARNPASDAPTMAMVPATSRDGSCRLRLRRT